MADVVDGAAGRRDALELALVGATDADADRDFVPGSDEIVDACLEVGEGVAHELEALLPGLASVKRLPHLCVMDHDVRRNDGEQSFRVPGVERIDRLAHEWSSRASCRPGM